jgi:hypothetical protein
MRTAWLFCKRTGQSKDTCFCEDCIREDAYTPPAWTQEQNEIETANVDMTVQYVREQVKLITETVRKANRHMAFNVKGGKATNGKKKQNGLPFLTIDDLSADKKRAKITWAGDPSEAGNNQDWARVTVKLEFSESGMKRLWTLGETNPCMDAMVSMMGEDAERWTGKELFLFTETHPVNEQKHIRVEMAKEASASRQRGASA